MHKSKKSLNRHTWIKYSISSGRFVVVFRDGLLKCNFSLRELKMQLEEITFHLRGNTSHNNRTQPSGKCSSADSIFDV